MRILIALAFLSPLLHANVSARVRRTTAANGRPQCTVTASGNSTDDVPNILSAFDTCGNGGDIIFPASEQYTIGTRLNPRVNDVRIYWHGEWTFTADLDYWRNNSYPVAFQNHAAGFVLSGDHIWIDGFGTGGIHGNGDAWYTAEAGETQPGRPMPFVFWNVSDVTVKNFFVKQPQLWALNIMNGTDMVFENIYCNATATKAPWGSNWVQNTDGFDTMDATNIKLHNFIYQGGDDCVAIKPRSYNIDIRNVTCRGGNGVTIGSLGQYLEDASVENVQIQDVDVIRYNEDMHNCAYIKTWVGALVPQSNYESAGQPRGAGWGSVRNILFANFRVQGADSGPSITQDNGNNGSFAGSSLMDLSNIAFVNFTGYLNNKSRTASVSCSNVHPCYNIDFKNVELRTAANETGTGEARCRYIEEGGVHGLTGDGC
ncbi:glycoside hydrolase family 28 protein [Aplosporella prunicola CBS 121167]|uniref:galacturonan 1,4-alpha-galacturonidase n=1 Tax=Aplosporella prunicola CBS 121167 TaxID=1176127 RepID=A0A6A6BHW1_9PEZI|nr:glycoside hydrolase family 28 protein [Aplosporella prunicola CBS 121167]KAF2143732.1 glycoside hydrolase family 28 protein [Aplosporella prunicola CBS 121167]